MHRRTIALVFAAVFATGARSQVELFEFHAAHKDQFGSAVDGAGDVDADGFDDVIVGANQSSLLGGTTGPGYVRVFSGADGHKLHEKHGDEDADRLGVAVAGGGDLDGDGHADFLADADKKNLGLLAFASGYARAWSGASGALLFEYPGSMLSDFGHSVEFAGDVDADGTVDVVVGAPGSSDVGTQTGRVDVFSGATGAPLLHLHGDAIPNTWSFPPPCGDRLGEAVAGAGDVDGDGHDDVLAGTASSWIFSGNNGNEAVLFSGATGDRLYRFTGVHDFDGFGMAVAAAGDIDADGVPDALVGAPFDTAKGQLFGGSARAFSGADGTLVHAFSGQLDFIGFGGSVAGLGDIDADGHDDFAIAAGTGENQVDAVVGARVFGGADGILLGSLEFAAGAKDGVRARVGSAGDVDGDGRGDLIVGVSGAKDEGAARVYSPALALGEPIASSSFAPGDVLSGSIGSNGKPDEARFLAVKGASVDVALELADPALAPVLSLHSAKGGKIGPALAEWTVSSGSPAATLAIAKSGAYALRVAGANQSQGAYELSSELHLPEAASSREVVATAKAKFKGKWVAEATLLAVAGSRLDVAVTGPPDTQPKIAIVTPSGKAMDAALYAATTVDSTTSIEHVPLLATGTYRVRVGGGQKGDTFVIDLDPTPPVSGAAIEID